jgi:hypothetical protein
MRRSLLPANSGVYRGVLFEILPAIKAEVPSPSASNFLHTYLQVSELIPLGAETIDPGKIDRLPTLAHKSHFLLRRFVS